MFSDAHSGDVDAKAITSGSFLVWFYVSGVFETFIGLPGQTKRTHFAKLTMHLFVSIKVFKR